MTKKKAAQVAKVSKETKVDVKDLARLPQDAIQKLDDMTPDLDEDVLLGGDEPELPPVDESKPSAEVPTPEQTVEVGPAVPPEAGVPTVETPESPSEKLPVEPQTTPTDVPEKTPDVHAGVMIGFHPVTEEPVYQ